VLHVRTAARMFAIRMLEINVLRLNAMSTILGTLAISSMVMTGIFLTKVHCSPESSLNSLSRSFAFQMGKRHRAC
jgi:hypothetical protein